MYILYYSQDGQDYEYRTQDLEKLLVTLYWGDMSTNPTYIVKCFEYVA